MSKKVKEILKIIGTNPKKDLGQNFLINKNKIQKIANKINEINSKVIIEIGPGLGSITKDIVLDKKKLICIEKDKILFEYLKKEFKNEKNFQIFNEDILKFDLNQLKFKDKLFFGNLPYNISAKIIENITDCFYNDFESKGIYMLQKEVAEKLLSKPGSKPYNAFVVKVQTFYNIKKILDLNESDFWPQPKIKSTLIKVENRKKNHFKDFDYKEFSIFLFNSFSERRKKIINNLQSYYPKALVIEKLNELNIDENIRPQDIEVDIFMLLFRNLKNSRSYLKDS